MQQKNKDFWIINYSFSIAKNIANESFTKIHSYIFFNLNSPFKKISFQQNFFCIMVNYLKPREFFLGYKPKVIIIIISCHLGKLTRIWQKCPKRKEIFVK